MDYKSLNNVGVHLTPADRKNFSALLDVLDRIEKLSDKIGKLNIDYMKIFKECSDIICNEMGDKTGWNKEDIHVKYNLPFEKICLEYDSINSDMKKYFKEWDENRELFAIIVAVIPGEGKRIK